MAQSISRRSFVTGMAASAAAGCTLAAGTAAADQPAAPPRQPTSRSRGASR